MESVKKNQVTELDLENSQKAFAYKSQKDLQLSARLYGLMNNRLFVGLSSKLGMLALRLRLPFSKALIKRTLYKLFVGGETLEETIGCTEKLRSFKVLTVLDYGVEGKSTEDELDAAKEHFQRAVRHAAAHENIPVITLKISGLASNDLLEFKTSGIKLNATQELSWNRVWNRLDEICKLAHDLGVRIFIDAEESWLQDSIDYLADAMMRLYNKDQVTVYNTYQLYRHDRLAFLKQSFEKAIERNYILGAKIVRGAYMEKERARAEKRGYSSPIHKDKDATDKDFNEAIRFCVQNYKNIALCTGTHNIESCRLQAALIDEWDLPKNHPHLNFCQLLGMSDNISFNLADAGYNVAKYVPYGPVRDVFPYLIRRAQENTAVAGDFSREYTMLLKELKRRKSQP